MYRFDECDVVDQVVIVCCNNNIGIIMSLVSVCVELFGHSFVIYNSHVTYIHLVVVQFHVSCHTYVRPLCGSISMSCTYTYVTMIHCVRYIVTILKLFVLSHASPLCGSMCYVILMYGSISMCFVFLYLRHNDSFIEVIVFGIVTFIDQLYLS